MESSKKTLSYNSRLNLAFSLIAIVTSAYALWFGLYDMYELNWDHNMHMGVVEQSSIFLKQGWVGYGGSYYKLANLALVIFSPAYAVLSALGFETSGVFSALILTNLLILTGFYYLLFRFFELEIRLLFPFFLLCLSSPLFYWSFRAYPDVMVAGLVGIGSLFLIVYLLTEKKYLYLVLSAAMLGIALQGKPTAFIAILALTPLLFISQRPVRDLMLFCAVLTAVFFLLGYPQNIEHILKQWDSLRLDENSWYVINKADFDMLWVKKYLKDYALVTLLPSFLFLFSNSTSAKNIRLSSSPKDVKILFAALFLASFGVTFFLMLKPLSLVTQHYTLITLPAHCLLFLFLSTYLKNNKFSFMGILLLSLAAFVTMGMPAVTRIHKEKTRHFSCIPDWQKAQAEISAADFRTVYTPKGILAGHPALYRPDDIYSKLYTKGEHQLLTGNYLNRFNDMNRKSKIIIDIESRVPTAEESKKIYNFFYVLASMQKSEKVNIENLEVELVQINKACGIKRFRLKL